MMQNIHNTILHENSWAESRQNYKTVTSLGAQKWWPMMVHENSFYESFFLVTAQNI